MTGEEWDTRRDGIFEDFMAQAPDGDDAEAAFVARMLADREAAERFGSRPEDVAS